jgi:hypothetical protein
MAWLLFYSNFLGKLRGESLVFALPLVIYGHLRVSTVLNNINGLAI